MEQPRNISPIERDTRDWERLDLRQELEQGGYAQQLRPFNDIITGRTAPQGYGDPVLRNITIDGRICDIYHTDKKEGDSGHRIFIHRKTLKQ